jgi:transcriptional regulator with XRE-family HTH domain
MNAGLSQAEIAQKLGYGNSQFVSNWERGASRPPLKVLKKVATLLKVSPQDLFQALLESSIEKLTSDLKKEFKGG